MLKKYNIVLSYVELEEMTYLHQVFMGLSNYCCEISFKLSPINLLMSPTETIRLHAVVPTLIRKYLEDYVEPSHPKYVIPKGMSVLILADSELYANPNEFDPEHFPAEQVKARETDTFLVFGDGPRNCIGARFGKLQSRIALALLVKNCRLNLAS